MVLVVHRMPQLTQMAATEQTLMARVEVAAVDLLLFWPRPPRRAEEEEEDGEGKPQENLASKCGRRWRIGRMTRRGETLRISLLSTLPAVELVCSLTKKK